MTPPDAALTERDLRTALGQFPTGVTIVTTRDPDGRPVGLTVSSFSSVSLSPPLVLWCLSHKASSLAAFEQCEHYAIHVLRAEQAEWARLFARRGADRFAQVGTRPGLGQVPLLSDTLATFECRNRSRHAEGDHTIFVGEVLRWSHHTHGAPLLHHRGTLLAPQAEAVHAGG